MGEIQRQLLLPLLNGMPKQLFQPHFQLQILWYAQTKLEGFQLIKIEYYLIKQS